MIKKQLYLLLSMLSVVFISCSDSSSTGPESTDYILQIIQSVNLDSLTSYVGSLSGETPVNINGQTYNIAYRNKNYPGNDIAANYIQQKFQQFGYTVENQNFYTTGRNILARKEGTSNSNSKYIICAHYDDMPYEPVAPGADDNASGVACVLEAARILSQYTFEYDVMFALWDEEEQGLVGSRYYAGIARNSNEEINGVINLDMISWERNGDNLVKVQENADRSADFIGGMLIDVIQRYHLQIEADTVHIISGSDHRSFTEQNYPAILMIEDYTSDWNANYHTPQDILSEMDLTYFHECSKAAIGTLARLIQIVGN
ncbi:MAG: hypothetical protein A2V66_12595 [Ignavibacteria bacterium RBG_13_36_8]|nr:MAG: hypothetical protein A2V66_12595 [Ignavibacteria bacterium RBG_13_36_8]